MRAHNQRHHTIDRLEGRGETLLRAQNKDIILSIACRGEAGTEPRTLHHRSPGNEMRAQRHGHHTHDCLEERGGNRAKDSSPSIAWGREAGTEPRTSHPRSPGGERRDATTGTEPRSSHHRLPGGEKRKQRKRSMTSLKVRERPVVSQTSIETFKDIWDSSERRGGSHRGFFERWDVS